MARKPDRHRDVADRLLEVGGPITTLKLNAVTAKAIAACDALDCEQRVDEAFRDACRAHGMDRGSLRPVLRGEGPLPRGNLLTGAA